MNTKQIILDATVKLMKSKDTKKLTVQKILNEAHVSRATFYSFFLDKYDVINYYFESYLDQVSKKEDDTNLVEVCAYQFIYDNKDYFMKAVELEGQNSFKKFFYDYYYNSCTEVYLKNVNKKELSNEEKIALSFYCMGAFHIFIEWLINGVKESPTEMAELTHRLIPEVYWKL